MAAQSSEVWPLVKARLGLADDVHQPLAMIYIDEIGRRILHYINHRSVPDGLLQVWAAMAAAALSQEQQLVLFPPPEPVEAAEISIGDTSIRETSTAPTVVKPSVAVMDAVVFDYRVDLNHYRRMRW